MSLHGRIRVQRSMSKIALITGITGQDGSYLAQLLLTKGYEVHGIRRRASSFNTMRLEALHQHSLSGAPSRLRLHFGDLTDASSLTQVIAKVQPDEIYNLGAQSHVNVSFGTPEYTTDVNALGPVRILEAIRSLKIGNKVRFYQASTSEIFGATQEAPQNESTAFSPRSPYAIAKLHAYWTTRLYRQAYGVHASNGILFNHESPMRGETFVTRKITRGIADIERGLQSSIVLGNLDATRDWGHARDYVEGMWRMLQQPEGDDYVLATGVSHTVRTFVETAFRHVGRTIIWEGEDLSEVGRDAVSGKVLVRCDGQHLRPSEVGALIGDASKAKTRLGWTPSTSFEDLVEEMMVHDMRLGGFSNFTSRAPSRQSGLLESA